MRGCKGAHEVAEVERAGGTVGEGCGQGEVEAGDGAEEVEGGDGGDGVVGRWRRKEVAGKVEMNFDLELQLRKVMKEGLRQVMKVLFAGGVFKQPDRVSKKWWKLSVSCRMLKHDFVEIAFLSEE